MGAAMHRIGYFIFAVATVQAGNALAHNGHGFVSSLSAGFSHPFGGLDHLLAMFAVGLLAAQLGGRAIWLVPSAFVATMIAGSLLGFAGIALPGAELAIGLSIIAIALPVAFALGMPVALAMIYVAIFALFHGYAHGAELPAGADASKYIAGFAMGTAIIHAVGVAAGLASGKYLAGRKGIAFRLAGGAVALAGAAVFLQ
jgi:urease accessory protein